MKKLLLTLLALPFLSFPAAAINNDGVAVTIYSSADPAGFDPQQFINQQKSGYPAQYSSAVPGFGVVKESREFSLTAGHNELRFQDVAEFIDPTTVSVVDINDPAGISVLEQNFQFDLVSPQKLLEKYIDHELEVKTFHDSKEEIIKGTLLSSLQNQLVLKTDTGLRITSGNDIKLAELPGGLITKPTLVWSLNATNAGKHLLRTTYQTDGITWRSDYNLILNQTENKADLSAWVTIMNLSGAQYNNAKLKLVAGDVEKIKPNQYLLRSKGMAYAAQEGAMADGAAGFEEKSFFEYHLYTLPRRINIGNNSVQQITLFPSANEIDLEKILVYYGLPISAYWWGDTPNIDRNLGSQANKKVDVYLKFKNEKANKLGIPLPAGKVRVFKKDDADGTMEFIGENIIDHTAKDEKVLIKIGQSFDVVGDRTQTDFTVDSKGRTLSESFQITLKNHKEKETKVLVKENLFRWATWEITESSDKYEKVDSRTVHFPISIPANGEKVIKYNVIYRW